MIDLISRVNPNYQKSIDAVSGATITSKGVADMLDNCLLPYRAFLENLSRQNQTH